LLLYEKDSQLHEKDAQLPIAADSEEVTGLPKLAGITSRYLLQTQIGSARQPLVSFGQASFDALS
jgi:hypothetical protein